MTRPEKKEKYTLERFGKFGNLLPKNLQGKKITADKSPLPKELEIKGLPKGEWINRGVYKIEHIFPWGLRYGKNVLINPATHSEILSPWGGGKSPVYLDLETTGLSGGTGSYAFLVGLGICESDAFRVLQLFLAGPGWERNWLAQLEAEIPEDNYNIVTYNGKTFDLPLLRTRYTLARSVPKWYGKENMDLLLLSRHFYRSRLDSCSLSNIELRILGLNRSDEDISGSEIPWLYTNFLRTQDARPLAGIFYHNTLDIISLAALQNHMTKIISGETESGWEILRAGDLWNKEGKFNVAEKHWKKELAFNGVKHLANARLAEIATKEGKFETAGEFFKQAISTDRTPVENLMKLAKIEEHKTKEFHLALEHAKAALDWIEHHKICGYSADLIRVDTKRRIARLERKIVAKQDKQ